MRSFLFIPVLFLFFFSCNDSADSLDNETQAELIDFKYNKVSESDTLYKNKI
jgi:hypothetical protein